MKVDKLKSLCLATLLFTTSLAAQHELPAGQTPKPQVIPIEPGKQVESPITGGERHLYSVQLKHGQFIRVEATQKDCDIYVALDAPDKSAQFEFKDDSYRNGPEVQTAGVSQDGTYILKIISFDQPTQKGLYTLKIAEIRPATDKELSQTAGFEITARLSKLDRGTMSAAQTRQMILDFEGAGAKFRFAGDKKNEAIAVSSIGSCYGRLGNWGKAIEIQRQALDMYRKLPQDKDLIFFMSNLANAYLHNYQPQEALELLTEAAGLATLRGDAVNESGVLGSIGKVYEDSGDIAKAIAYYTRSLEKANINQFPNPILTALLSLGTANSILGDNKAAIGYFERAIEISRQHNSKKMEAAALTNLADCLAILGEIEKAESLLNEALAIDRSLADRMAEAGALKTFAQVRLKAGKADDAIEMLRQAREIFLSLQAQRGVADLSLLLANAYEQKGDLAAAQTNASAAIDMIEKMRSGFRTAELRDTFSQNLQRFYAAYVRILMEREKREPGKGFAQSAFQASEAARARGLINLLAESNADIRKGVDRSLLEKEAELKDLLSARFENLTKILSRNAKPEIAGVLKNEIDEIRTQHERVLEQIRTASPRYAALTQPKTLSLAEIQTEVLDRDSVLLEYHLGAKTSYLWIVTPTSFESVELPPADTIERSARDLYSAMTARNNEVKFETAAERDARIARSDKALVQTSQELSAMIIGRASRTLGAKRVLVVADGALQYVPFAALPLPNAGFPRPAATRYLIENNEIVSLPSASALSVLRKETDGRPQVTRSVAVLADPIFDKKDERFQALSGRRKAAQTKDLLAGLSRRQTRSAVSDLRDGLDLKRLPFTRREADLITAVAPAGQKEKWLDFDASRATATSSRLSDFRYVHFATHGLINDKEPELSGLVFSTVDEKGKDIDGFLRVGDIYGLKLPSEMIVLSGCRTGLGQNIKGEGMIGMTRAFMYAGAKRVTVSLWDINDEATSQLMANLYREMFVRKQSPAAALRLAQTAMIKDRRWSNPYYWATFVLQGEPK